jgi:hypothetical protein
MKSKTQHTISKKAGNNSLTSSLPSIFLITYTIILSLLVFKSSILINTAISLVHYLIFLKATKFKATKTPLKLIKKLMPLFIIIIFVSTLFSTGGNIIFTQNIFGYQLKATMEGFFVGIKATSAYIALLTAISLFQIDLINLSFINLAERFSTLTPLLLSYKFILHEGKKSKVKINPKKASSIINKLEEKIGLLEKFIKKEKIKGIQEQTIYISTTALLLTTLRAVKILPGIPIVPGHKLLITIPLFYFVSVKLGNYSATITAWTVGLLSLLLGLFGQLAVIDFVRLILLGFLVDISAKLLPAGKLPKIAALTIYGAIMGFVFAYIGVVFFVLLKVPKAFYIASTHKFIFNTIFGAMSGIISYKLITTDNYQAKN